MTTCRLTVILDEDATHNHRPQYQEIVHRAHAAGLAGASVFRGIEGFGASRAVHTSRILSLAGKLPVMVVIVDDAEKVRAFVPVLTELGVRGVTTLEDVEVL
jgi:PII-like signaling protein